MFWWHFSTWSMIINFYWRVWGVLTKILHFVLTVSTIGSISFVHEAFSITSIARYALLRYKNTFIVPDTQCFILGSPPKELWCHSNCINSYNSCWYSYYDITPKEMWQLWCHSNYINSYNRVYNHSKIVLQLNLTFLVLNCVHNFIKSTNP